jgi:hypothetical protein
MAKFVQLCSLRPCYLFRKDFSQPISSTEAACDWVLQYLVTKRKDKYTSLPSLWKGQQLGLGWRLLNVTMILTRRLCDVCRLLTHLCRWPRRYQGNNRQCWGVYIQPGVVGSLSSADRLLSIACFMLYYHHRNYYYY